LADTYPVTVEGTISVDPELLALMRRGRQFRLTCELIRVDAITSPIGLLTAGVTNVYGGGSTATRPFKFSNLVARSRLDEDDESRFLGICTGDEGDEIQTQMHLTTRRSSATPSKPVKLADGLTYYMTNEISRDF
jgi:hypothetical protein